MFERFNPSSGNRIEYLERRNPIRTIVRQGERPAGIADYHGICNLMRINSNIPNRIPACIAEYYDRMTDRNAIAAPLRLCVRGDK
jgi:hypothetical protein